MRSISSYPKLWREWREKNIAALLYTDGGARISNPGHTYGSYMIFDEDRKLITCEMLMQFGWGTNNEAEFMIFILGLQTALHATTEDIICYTDSMLVQKLVTGQWKTRVPTIKTLAILAKSLVSSRVSVHHTPRKYIKEVLGH